MSTATASKETTSKAPSDKSLLERIIEQTKPIREITASCNLNSMATMDDLERTIRMADAMTRLRAAITPDMMRMVMSLMNSPLGFLTDRDPSKPSRDNKPVVPYPENIVRDCWIESMLHGARTVGNEWNIIGGRCYLTQEHFVRIFREIDGISTIVESPGVPVQRPDGKTVVRYHLAWKLYGQPDCLRDHDGKPGRVFVIRVNQAMGDDAIIGKAKRKAYKAAYEQATGSKMLVDIDEEVTSDGEIIEKPVETLAASLDGLTKQLKGEEPGELFGGGNGKNS